MESVHRALLAVDVESSGGKDSHASAIIRRALANGLRDAFLNSGIDWSMCTAEDRGDGMIVAIPPQIPKAKLVFPLLDQLDAVLRHHNRYAGEPARMRLRVALHAGDLLLDGTSGATGRPYVLLARLLDCAELRAALRAAPATTPMAVLVSDHFYQDVVSQGHLGIDADRYAPVRVSVKETQERAWLRTTDGVALPAPQASAPPSAAPPAGGISFTGSAVRIGGDVVGGDKIGGDKIGGDKVVHGP